MTARGCLWHRRSPLKRSTGRPSRQPVEPELQKETDGRIDRSEVRDTPWDPLARKGRWFVWNSRRGNHLGQRSTKPHQQAGHMDASDPIRPSKTLAARGPSTYGSRIALTELVIGRAFARPVGSLVRDDVSGVFAGSVESRHCERSE